MTSSYSSLLRVHGVARTMAAQLLARFPGGMISLGFLIHIQSIFDSYGAAGLVLGASAIGQAVAGPVTSRMMGRFGPRRILIITTLLCAASLAVIALVVMPLWGFMLVGAISGLTVPPVQPAVRTMYPKLVDSAHLPRLFSLDASAQEIIWVAGPLVITVVAREVSSVAGILLCIVFLVGGGAWFISLPEMGRVDLSRSKSRFGAVLLRPGVMLATALGLLLIASTAAIEAGVVSRFGEGGAQAGVVLALSAAASLAGGLTLGHKPIHRWTMARNLAIVTVGAVLAAVASGVAMSGATLMLFGFGVAPALAVMYTMISVSVSFGDSVEAYGWLGTGQLVGAAIGSAFAGFMIDASGSIGGFAASAVMAIAAVVVAALFRGAQPRMSGVDLLPD